MRPLLPTLLLLLPACGPAGPSSADSLPGTDPTNEVAQRQGRARLEQLGGAARTSLLGDWMPEAYCHCLEERRSALACAEHLPNWYVVSLSPSAASDSIIFGAYTTHEGGPEVILGYDTTQHLFRSTHHELTSVRSLDHDWMELIAPEFAPENYRRVVSEEHALNSLLLTGSYTRDGSKDTVVFHADGHLEGLRALERFSVLTDFTEGHHDHDVVFLYNGEDPHWIRDAYHYRINGDELSLFAIDSIGEYQFRIGDLKYALRRVR